MIFYNLDQLIFSGLSLKLPVIIPTFNNPEYLVNMVKQLNKYELNDIIIIDNNSSYPPMQEILREMSEKYIVVAKSTNEGPRECYENKLFYDWLPDKFILTDPDIGFNENLPSDFVNTLSYISDSGFFKVGFALDIEFDAETFIRDAVIGPGKTIYSWESSLYNDEVGQDKSGNPIYRAALDTTFCLINKKQHMGGFLTPSARVGGDFKSQHYGWYTNPPVSKEEEQYTIDHATKWSSTIAVRKGIYNG